MTKLKIISDNAAARASLTTSSHVGALIPDNMLKDKKSVVWRSSGTTEKITCTWPKAELLGGISLAFCNFTATATIRVRVYSEEVGGTELFDSGIQPAARHIPLGYWSWGEEPLGVNAYSYGFSIYSTCWFNTFIASKRVEIDIVDTDNVAGYIEVGNLIIGKPWIPKHNTAFGLPVTFTDSAVNVRTEASDLVSTTGSRSKKVAVDLSWLEATDRTRMASILQVNGVTKPIFVSVFPDDTDVIKEYMYQVYGKMPTINAITHPGHIIYSTQLEIEEL